MNERLGFFRGQPATGQILRRQDTFFIPFHALRTQRPKSDWSTEEDRFGVMALEDGATTIAVHPLPQRFPEQQTGGAWMRREFELLAETERHLLFLLESPFGVSPWGTRRFLFAFDLIDRRWRRLEHPEQGAHRVDPLVDEEAVGDPASGEHVCGLDVQWPELGGTVHLEGGAAAFRTVGGHAVPRTPLARRSERVENGRLWLDRAGSPAIDLGPWPQLVEAELGADAKEAVVWSAVETSWKGRAAILLTVRTRGGTVADPRAAVLVLALPGDGG